MRVSVEPQIAFSVAVETQGVVQVLHSVSDVVEVEAAGPQGPQGMPGVSGASYIHNQDVPADVWAINHGLARFPSITVVDSAGDEVEGDTRFIDANTIQIIFSSPFAGKAYIN